jgi:hypothetical protein
MFATIRRHQKWMWAAIIAVIIPSFVIFFSPNVDLTGRSRASFGSLRGNPITQQEYANAYYETQLRYFFSYGDWPGRDDYNRQTGFDLDRETRSRVLILDTLRAEKIYPSEEATAKWILNLFRDRKQNVFRMDAYQQFIKKTLAERGIRESDFERFAGHEVAIQELISAHGLNGRLITPREAEARYRQENELIETEAVLFSASNHLRDVTINTTNLAMFYTNRIAVYRIPERVQVSYVKCDLTNFLAEGEQQLAKETNLTQTLNAVYQQQGPNFFVDTNGAVMSETAAKEKIKEQFKRELSLQAARKKAATFAMDLYKMTPATSSEPPKVENLNLLAASNNIPVLVTEPFTEQEGPKSLRVMENFARAAFALTPTEPFSPPINGEDGIYILAYNKRIPAEIPSLESIKDTVTEDYRRAEAMRIARSLGAGFEQMLTNSLAQGKTFAAACSEFGAKPITVPAFSLATSALPELDPRLDLPSIKDAVANLPVGKATRFIPTRDGGYIVYLRARLPVDEKKMKEELPEFTKTLRQSRQFDAFSDWFSHEASLARLSEPAQQTTDKTKPQR